MTDEIWAPIRDWEGLYEVSSLGRIKALPRPDSRLRLLREGRILPESRDSNGYVCIHLAHKGRKTTIKAHQAVLQAFVGPQQPGHHSRHLNAVRHDNRLSNLEYGTPEQNADDKEPLGLQCRGEKHGRAKLTQADVDQIRELAKAMTHTAIAKQFSVSIRNIGMILSGKSWHPGPQKKRMANV